MNVVLKRWEDDNINSLFVSEGTSTQKVSAISRSPYLNTVAKNVLPSLEGNVLVYGWSMSDSDEHIAKCLIKSNTSAVAISVHTEGKTNEAVDHTCSKLRHLISKLNPTVDVDFFDAADEGCWLKTRV